MKRMLLGLMLTMGATLADAAKTPPPSIGVSPARLEIVVENGAATGSATVLNLSDRTIHVNTEVVNFDLDDGNNFRQQPPEPGSLPMALMINPVEFSIPPHGSQTVRFAVLPERLKGPGEHRAMLFFSELVDTSHRSLKVKFRLGVPIYASFGSVQSLARLHRVDFDTRNHQLLLDLSAIGNAQVKPDGYYLWWPLSEYPAEEKALARVAELAAHPERKPPERTTGGRVQTKPVFPGARRSVVASIGPPPEEGEYMLVYRIEAGGQIVQRAVRYTPSELLIVDSN